MTAAKKNMKPSRKTPDEERLPGRGEALAAYAAAGVGRLEKTRKLLAGLHGSEPQLIHFEGGTEEERCSLAMWWAAFIMCGSSTDAGPCLQCPDCIRVGAGMHPDLYILDGRKGSIKIESVRGLRPLMGEKPHFARKRVILLAEAQALGIPAANSLLKILEEPAPDTCFLFTTPQRERLLPTLVSRGWVVTLPWPDPAGPLSDAMERWDSLAADFLSTGRGWFDQQELRNALDATAAQQVVLVVQKALAASIARPAATPLSRVLCRLPEPSRMQASELLVESQEALQGMVAPLLVLDRLMTMLSIRLEP